MPLHQLGLDLCQASLDRGILVRLKAEEIPRHFRQAVVLEHPLDECRDVLPAGGADDTKLSRIAPESIGELRLHADQAFPHGHQHAGRLPFLRLHRYEPHARAG